MNIIKVYLFITISSENFTIIIIIGDTLQSIGVIIAAVIIYVWQSPEGSKNPNKIKLADPICTFVFAILVLFTTTHVVKDCLKILMVHIIFTFFKFLLIISLNMKIGRHASRIKP